MNFQKVNLGLFKTLAGKIPWEIVLNGKGVKESWTVLKKEISVAQEKAVLVCHKMNQWGRSLACMKKKLLL